MAVLSKDSSNIKIKSIGENKKKCDTSTAEKKVDKIGNLLDEIATCYENVTAAYKKMLDTAGLDDNGGSCKLDTSTTVGTNINSYYQTLDKRAKYCRNRKTELNSAYAEASGTESEYLSKRIAKLEKELAEMKKAQQEDKDATS